MDDLNVSQAHRTNINDSAYLDSPSLPMVKLLLYPDQSRYSFIVIREEYFNYLRSRSYRDGDFMFSGGVWIRADRMAGTEYILWDNAGDHDDSLPCNHDTALCSLPPVTLDRYFQTTLGARMVRRGF